ncbi:MAG: peptidase domain-containing ABC transporter [Gemmatimonadaceae bacterium]
MDPNPIPRLVTQWLAARLGTETTDAAWRADLARLDPIPALAAPVADRIVEAGRRAGIGFLRRSLGASEWGAYASRLEAPVVLLADHPTAGLRIALVERRDDAAFVVREVTATGTGEPGVRDAAALLSWLSDGGIIGALIPTAIPAIGPPPTREPTPLERLWELLYVERGNIGLVYAYATLVGLFSLTLPLGVQAIIGLVSGGLLLQPVVLLIGFVVLGTLATGVLQVLQLAAVESIQQRIFARFALEFSLRVPRVGLEETWHEDLPERMNRFFEVVTIQKSLGKLLTGTTTALLQVVFGLLLLTFYHPYFTLFSLGLVVSLALTIRLTGPRGLETSLKESTYKYRAVHWLEEVARAVTTFKAAGRATPALEQMDAHVSGYLRYRQRHFRVLVTQAMAAIGFKVVVTGALLILGSALVVDRQITLGQFVAAELVIVTVLAGIEKLVNSIAEVYDVITSVVKLGHVTELPLERSTGLALDSGRGLDVRLDGVTYRYADASRDAIQDVSIAIAPGERVAVIGADGSGTSTLLSVLGGVLPSCSGLLRYDGITHQDIDPASLRDRLGLLLATAPFFDGTVEENITLGRTGIGPADVREALTRVGAAVEVQALPKGVQAELTNDGRGLPTSLRVRLLVARAIVNRPRLLILDDWLTNVEPETRRELVAMLTDRSAPWTLVMVSHSRELLEACDRVLVLHAGRVRALGVWSACSQDPYVEALVPATGGSR